MELDVRAAMDIRQHTVHIFRLEMWNLVDYVFAMD